MYSYISLKVDCPQCGESLMDSDVLVDDIPSIKLSISENGERGTIRLSSFYGSYNYECDIDVHEDLTYQFYCPHCFENLNIDMTCVECSSTMVPLKIRDGGEVRFCSRAGCTNHNVEFVDLANVHEYFKQHIEEPEIIEINNAKEKAIQKELIKSGTFLRIYCPHCKKSLIEKNSVMFKILNQSGEKGYLMLSPYLNVFAEKSTIFIPDGAVASDIMCPFCEKSLVAEERRCLECKSPAVNVDVAAVRKMIDFYFCSMKGCHWHSLSEEDLHHVLLEDSLAW